MGIIHFLGGICMGLIWSTDGRTSLGRSEIASQHFPLNVSSFEGKSVTLQKRIKAIFGREAGWSKLSFFSLPGVAVLCY